jgi:hypothetical protein
MPKAGWFPTYTLGEDMALALEIQQAGWKGAYVKARPGRPSARGGHRFHIKCKATWGRVDGHARSAARSKARGAAAGRMRQAGRLAAGAVPHGSLNRVGRT